MYIELKEDNLEEIVKQNETIFVQFSATWCGNCRVMKPKFKKMGNEKSAHFVVVDAEKFPLSRQLAQVNNLPTFAAFRDGKLVAQVQTNKIDILNSFVDENTSN